MAAPTNRPVHSQVFTQENWRQMSTQKSPVWKCLQPPIYNSGKPELLQIAADKRMNEWTAEYSYSGMLLRDKQKQTYMRQHGWSQNNQAEWTKPGKRGPKVWLRVKQNSREYTWQWKRADQWLPGVGGRGCGVGSMTEPGSTRWRLTWGLCLWLDCGDDVTGTMSKLTLCILYVNYIPVKMLKNLQKKVLFFIWIIFQKISLPKKKKKKRERPELSDSQGLPSVRRSNKTSSVLVEFLNSKPPAGTVITCASLEAKIWNHICRLSKENAFKSGILWLIDYEAEGSLNVVWEEGTVGSRGASPFAFSPTFQLLSIQFNRWAWASSTC